MKREPSKEATGLAHVATVSFLASRAAPSLQFFFALGGGIALARAAKVAGARIGHGVSLAAMLQTVAVMGPARVNGPLTQAITAPMMGRLQARGASRLTEFLACFALRLLHYAVLLVAFIYVILGGFDEFTGSYETLTGWLGIVPQGPAAALVFTAAGQVLWAVFFSALQVAAYRRALGDWPAAGELDALPEGRGRAAAAADSDGAVVLADGDGSAAPAEGGGAVAAAAADGHGSAAPAEAGGAVAAPRFDPRAVVLAALVASILLLASTAWTLLACVAAWLVPAWLLARADRDAVPLGLALAGLLAFAALSGGLLSGAGLEPTLQRVLRAVLLVAVATWMRAAAGADGLREVFRRALLKLGRIPGVREGGEVMAGLDAGPRLIAAGRAAASRFADVELRPAELCDAVTAWVSAESEAFRPGEPAAPARLRLRAVDGVLVAFTLAPAFALLAPA